MPRIFTKPWLVQKYGGTSIGKQLPIITSSIIPSYLEGYRVAAVCSARSGTTKTSGTTSLLLEAIRLTTISDPQSIEMNAIVDTIRRDHLFSAEQAAGSESMDALQTVQLEIMKDCERLRSLLSASIMLDEIPESNADRILSIGETLSCRIVAASLQSQGFASQVIILDDIVEDTYGDNVAQVLKEFKKHPSAFFRGLTHAIGKKIEACGSDVPVITGFFGAMPGSLIKCVSRGYSDLCAALCAVALGAEELQIWKEVDGILTADPRKVKGARLLPTITSEEAAELTYYGSEVIHPLTIEQTDNAHIPLRLKNVLRPQAPGTVIHPSQKPATPPEAKSKTLQNEPNMKDIQSKVNFMAANGYYGSTQYRRRPTAITAKDSISILTIRSNGTTSPSKFLSYAIQHLETHDLTVDLISSSQQMLSFAVCAPDTTALSWTAKNLEELGQVTIMSDMSIVSVIGHKMRNMVGIGAEIFTALAGARLNIYLISQGASEINISFVVRSIDARLAMEVVHEHVLKIPRHEEMENIFAKGPWLY